MHCPQDYFVCSRLHFKVEIFTIGEAVGFFESIGLAAIVAYRVIAGEVLEGIALILGAFTRLAAWLSIPILIEATWMHLGNDWVFSAEGGGWEFTILLVTLALAISLGGAGKYAIDNLEWMKNLNFTQPSAEQATA